MNQILIVAFIQNAGLLLALVFVYDFVTAQRRVLATPARQALAGVAIGLIGVSMVGLSVPLQAGTIFDTRSVLLAISGLFLGGWPTVIGVAMTSAYRMALGGADFTGVAVIVVSGMIGVLWRRVRRGPLEEVKWEELYTLGIVVHIAMLALMFTMPRETAIQVVSAIALPVMVVHPLATLALGLLFTQRLRSHRTAADLERSENRFRLLAENARDLIYRYEFSPVRGFVYVSPSATAFTGYSPEELYADPDITRRIVHPDDHPLLDAIGEEGEKHHDTSVFRLIRKDGQMIWAEQRNTHVLDEDGRLVALEGIVRDVTSTKQADAMIRMALRAANQGLYDVDLQTGETRVSAEFARMLGYEPGEFVETHEKWESRLHPDDRERVLAAYRNTVEGREPDYGVEFRERTRDGEWLWILSLGSIVAWDAAGKPLRLLGTRTDISALKRAEEQTRAAQAGMARLLAEGDKSRRALLSLVEDQQKTERQLSAAQQLAQSTLDALTQHICVLDEDGSIIAVNNAWRAFAEANGGTTDAVLTGANYLTVCQSAAGREEQQAAEVATALRAVLDGKTDSYSLEYRCDSPDEQRWFHLQITRFSSDGPARVVVAHEDITARKRAEQARLELTAQLNQAQRLESLGSLAGGVAHDINNVLAAILSLASGHRRHVAESDPLAKSLDTIVNACVRGRSVVRSLLYFARSDMESRGPVDLNTVVRDIIELLASTTLRRVDFSTDLAEDLPTITGDVGALSHAVMNLCINSLDAMPEGGSVTIGTKSRPDGFIELSVRDTGTGMTPEVREKAIEPFFTTKPVGKGTGLGLAMVFGTVKAHEGSIEIISAPGQGTEVVLTLPANASHEADSSVSAQPFVPRVDAGGVLRTLIVDDDTLIGDAIAALLEMEGHEVTVTTGGAEALERFAGGLEVDLVILDMNMPGMNGAETLERLLQIRPDQIVMMCSGHWEEQMARLTERPNVLSLQKPFTLDEFAAKLESVGLKC